MDSVEVSVDHTESEGDHIWHILVQTFSAYDASLGGEQMWVGTGESISEHVVAQVLRAVQRQTLRVIQDQLGVHCVDHEVLFCEACGTVAWMRGPFD